MSRSEKVQSGDLQKLRGEILAEVANHFDATLGEAIVGRILGRASERAANIQKAENVAIANRDQAQKEVSLFEDRLVRVKAEIGELSKERNELQTTVAKLQADYDALVPKVSKLREEEAGHVARVRKIAG